jgi:Glyoxalase/Bleomycin resistance protein/Dioxygenase superfamily
MEKKSPVKGIIQVGWVVKDLDKALDHYTNKLGVGPWAVYTFSPPRLTGMKVRGKETSYSMKLAVTRHLDVMWELIQPLEGPSIYKEFLTEHGEGQHHVMISHEGTPLEQVYSYFEGQGWPPLMEGKMEDLGFAYFDTERELRTIIEIRYHPKTWRRPEPDYWYPRPPTTPWT